VEVASVGTVVDAEVEVVVVVVVVAAGASVEALKSSSP
jgi:hypothetical protein